jgi:hypothetical protein
MCYPAADRLSGQAGGNHVLRTPSADYSPTGDSKPSWNSCKREPSLEWLNQAYDQRDGGLFNPLTIHFSLPT